MTIKRNNPGKTDLIRDYPVFIPVCRPEASGGRRPTSRFSGTGGLIRVPTFRFKRCGYGLVLAKRRTKIVIDKN
jgi:hypothetical protein